MKNKYYALTMTQLLLWLYSNWV